MNRIHVPEILAIAKSSRGVGPDGLPLNEVLFIEPSMTIKELIEKYKAHRMTGEIKLHGKGITRK
jgi:hypothetical protein